MRGSSLRFPATGGESLFVSVSKPVDPLTAGKRILINISMTLTRETGEDQATPS